jgi:hypothetical protein
MDQPLPPALGWPLTTHGVLTLIAAVVVAVLLWRHHADTQAMLRRMDADLARDRRLAEVRDRLYLESLPEERRAQELELRAQLAERERRAQEILAQEEAAREGGTDGRG